MKRSKFSLSHFKELTCDMGFLIPITCLDVLPGDRFSHRVNLLIRMAPMLAPVMHPIYARVHHWYVPYRLIWEEFEDFITGGPAGYGVDVPDFPTISIKPDIGTLADYLGLPLTQNPIEVSALPFRAYNLIWNNFYRDQDLQQELPISTASGSDTTTQTDLQRIAWQKDYFTTARPWTQKGIEISVPVYNTSDVSDHSYISYVWSLIPTVETGGHTYLSSQVFDAFKALNIDFSSKNLQDSVTVTVTIPHATAPVTYKFRFVFSSKTTVNGSSLGGYVNSVSGAIHGNQVTSTARTVYSGNIIYNSVSESSKGNVSVSDLRQALALQRFEEHRAKWGSRYIEFLQTAFGVNPRDYRLQLPEYLGGGRQDLRISEVLQTAQGDDPVGTMRGHGMSLMGSNRYVKSFPEHGVLLTFLSFLPVTMYTQGISRMWSKRTPTDFFMREFAGVGMQEVFTKELYGDADPDLIFGYQDRYDEYRFAHSTVSGDFRGTLDFWNLSRQFANAPVLNGTFVSCHPSQRIFASQNTHNLWVLAYHTLRARRVVPKHAKNVLK